MGNVELGMHPERTLTHPQPSTFRPRWLPTGMYAETRGTIFDGHRSPSRRQPGGKQDLHAPLHRFSLRAPPTSSSTLINLSERDETILQPHQHSKSHRKSNANMSGKFPIVAMAFQS